MLTPHVSVTESLAEVLREDPSLAHQVDQVVGEPILASTVVSVGGRAIGKVAIDWGAVLNFVLSHPELLSIVERVLEALVEKWIARLNETPPVPSA